MSRSSEFPPPPPDQEKPDGIQVVQLINLDYPEAARKVLTRKEATKIIEKGIRYGMVAEAPTEEATDTKGRARRQRTRSKPTPERKKELKALKKQRQAGSSEPEFATPEFSYTGPTSSIEGAPEDTNTTPEFSYTGPTSSLESGAEDTKITPEQDYALTGLGYPDDVRAALGQHEAEELIRRHTYYYGVAQDALKNRGEMPPIPTFETDPTVVPNQGTFGPETYAENHEALRGRINEVQERLQRRNAKAEKNVEFSAKESEAQRNTDAAKDTYFEALRKYQRSRTADSALAERLGFTTTSINEGGASLRELRREWIEARSAQARIRLEAVAERREGRGTGIRGMRSAEDVAKRYERRYVARDILHGAVKEEQDFRLKALRERDVNGVELLWKAYQKLPPAARVVISGAGITAAAVGAATAGGLIAAAPMLALGGYGVVMRWRAQGTRKELDILRKRREAKQGEFEAVRKGAVESEQRAEEMRIAGMDGKFEQSIADRKYNEYQEANNKWDAAERRLEEKARKQEKAAGFNFFGLGSWAADKLLGRAQKSKANAADITISGLRNVPEGRNYTATGLSDAYNLAEQSDAIAVSYRTKQQQESLRSTVKTGAGLAAGFAGGFAVGSVVDAFDGPDAPTEAGGAGPERADATGGREGSAGDAPERPDAPERGGSEASDPVTERPDAAPSESARPEAPSEVVSEASINPGSGEGFNSLFAKLDTRGIENPSAVVEHLRNTSPSELSSQIEALVGDESAVMRGGDQLVLDDNQNVWFLRQGEEPRLVFENSTSAEGGFTTHVLEGVGRASPTVVEVQPEVRAEEVSASETASAEVPVEPTVTAPVIESTVEAEVTPEVSVESPIIAEEVRSTPLEEVRGEQIGQLDGSRIESADSTAGTAEIAPQAQIETGTALRPEAPWDFPGISPDEFVNAYNITMDPTTPSAYVDANDNVFFYGGTYDQLRAAAEQYAIEHPGIAVSYEGDPIIGPNEDPTRWTAVVTADESGRVFNPPNPTHEAQLDNVPNPNSFVRRAS